MTSHFMRLFLLLQDSPQPLHGVIIAVSKKLSSRQGEYNKIAASLGAEYHWTYDNSCTHFIFRVSLVSSYRNVVFFMIRNTG